MIHMKCQVLFFPEKKKKKRMSSAADLFSANSEQLSGPEQTMDMQADLSICC